MTQCLKILFESYMTQQLEISCCDDGINFSASLALSNAFSSPDMPERL